MKRRWIKKWSKLTFMRAMYEIKCKRATMNPRYAHSYSTNFVNWRVNELQCVSDQRRAQFDSYMVYLSFRWIRYFTWFIWSISMKPIVCIVEDIRFAFDNRRWCNPRHFLARSRNVKWPRTWLACLHSGSRRFNDVANKWPMLYIDPLKKNKENNKKKRTRRKMKRKEI